MIHFELIFCVRCQGRGPTLFFCGDNELFQHHFLKRLFFPPLNYIGTLVVFLYITYSFAKFWYRITWSKLICLSERTVHMHKFHDFRVPTNCVVSSILCQMCQFNQVLCNVKMLACFLNRSNTYFNTKELLLIHK